jgi:hypothetical protein
MIDLDTTPGVAEHGSETEPVGESPTRSAQIWWGACALLFGVIGLALRLRALTAGRSLWLDEAMLACNICGRSFAELLQPLDDQQGAPVGFLMLARSAVSLFGPNEVALRLVPMIASIATLGLVYVYCRGNDGPAGGAIGVGLAAVMPAMIYYAAEAKQYSLDIAIGMLIPTLTAPALRDRLSVRRAAMLAVVGAVAVWLSHPSVFVLAGAGSTLIVAAVLRRRFNEAALGIGVSAIWFASFMTSYVLFLKGLQSSSYLAEFWSSGFLRVPPRSPGDLKQYVAIFLGFYESMYQNFQVESGIEVRMAVVVATVWLAGAALLALRGAWTLLALLVLPLIFAAGASALHMYPLRVRMVLFAAGPNLLVMTAGLSTALRSSDRAARVLGGTMLAGVSALPLLQAMHSLLERPQPYGARSVLVALARQWQSGDVVVVDGASEAPFRFYQSFARIEDLDRLEPSMTANELRDPEALSVELERWRGRPRVWFVITAHMGDPGGREDRFLLHTLDRLSRQRESIFAKGYQAHLCDLTDRRHSDETGHEP